MTDTAGQENPEKSALEAEKLSLEKRLLQRQLSVQGLLMAWLQAAAVPVALIGAILAFFIGFGQLHQNADNQAADRFDKSLTRLASTRPDERMTGVSGLQLFLNDGNKLLQNQALQFLINGLSMETDTRVRGGILDVLGDLRPDHPSQTGLDEALRTAVARNRSLTKLIVSDRDRHIAQQKKAILTKFKIADLDVAGMGDEIPAKVIAALTTEQYLALLDAEHGPFDTLDPIQEVPLIGLRDAIRTLVAQGATSRDFKGIYCEECDFRTAKSLDGAVFDGAYLMAANFEHVSLQGASFRNADLGGANFFGADLTKADLRMGRLKRGFANKGFLFLLPLLECTKLGGADLSGQPLILFEHEFNTTSGGEPTFSIQIPRMATTQIDASTKLDKIGILVATNISDDYLRQHSDAPEARPLTTDRDGLWENPLEDGSWRSADFRRILGDFAKDASKYTQTIAMLQWSVDAEGLNRLGNEAFMLRGVIDQSVLKALPLYSMFVDKVRALTMPAGDAAKKARAWRDKAAESLAALHPLSCSEHPNASALLFTR